jgi:host factor-I protein
MMSKGAMNLQDSFLNQVRRENVEVKVLLVNGTTLRGIVKGFDNFTVILNNRNGQHLIYKHAIAQLVSQRSGGPRREGEEEQSSDGSTDPHPADPVEARQSESRQSEPRQADGGGRQKPRNEGFNKIDLSGVKLSEEKVSTK